MTTPYQYGAWRQVRVAVLDRDGHRCQIRLPGCTSRATQVDHRIDWRDGGAWFDPTNLRAACAACNVAQRNQRVAARARRARQAGEPLGYPGSSRNW